MINSAHAHLVHEKRMERKKDFPVILVETRFPFAKSTFWEHSMTVTVGSASREFITCISIVASNSRA